MDLIQEGIQKNVKRLKRWWKQNLPKGYPAPPISMLTIWATSASLVLVQNAIVGTAEEVEKRHMSPDDAVAFCSSKIELREPVEPIAKNERRLSSLDELPAFLDENEYLLDDNEIVVMPRSWGFIVEVVPLKEGL